MAGATEAEGRAAALRQQPAIRTRRRPCPGYSAGPEIGACPHVGGDLSQPRPKRCAPAPLAAAARGPSPPPEPRGAPLGPPPAAPRRAMAETVGVYPSMPVFGWPVGAPAGAGGAGVPDLTHISAIPAVLLHAVFGDPPMGLQLAAPDRAYGGGGDATLMVMAGHSSTDAAPPRVRGPGRERVRRAPVAPGDDRRKYSCTFPGRRRRKETEL